MALVACTSLEAPASPLFLERLAAFSPATPALLSTALEPSCALEVLVCASARESAVTADSTTDTFDAYVRRLGDAVGTGAGAPADVAAPVAWTLAAAGVEPPRAAVLHEMTTDPRLSAEDASLVETVSTYVQQVPEPGWTMPWLGASGVLLRRRGRRRQASAAGPRLP